MGIEMNNEQIYAGYQIEHWWNSNSKQLFQISGAAGTGKCQPIDTLIPTPNGIRKLKDIKIRDMVYNRNGKPVEVVGEFSQGTKEVYEVTLDDGRKTLCNSSHLWTYYDIHHKSLLQTVPLKEMIENGVKNDFDTYYYKIPLTKAVEYSFKDFKYDPYIIGYYSNDVKDIPEDYLYGNITQRLSLIQGVFDNNHHYIKINKKEKTLKWRFKLLKKSFIELIRDVLFSLGYSSIISKNNELILNLNNPQEFNFFRYDRKGKEIKLIKNNDENNGNYIINIKSLGYKTEMKCIYVDDDEHLYLTNNYIVTHNTTLVRYAIDRLGLTYDEVLFVAFMGKAATCLARNGLPAKTIHSTIYDYEKVLARDENGKIIFKENGKPKMVSKFIKKDRLNKNIKLIVVDEGSMVEESIAKDLMSYGIPIIVLGDLNQLPPVFGKSFFLTNPDVVLTQIMRQAENDPIVWLSQEVLSYHPLKIGVYGNSAVISKDDLNEYHMRNADIIITGTNKLRYNVNNYIRERIKGYKNFDYPHMGEKIICKKNNWSKSIGEGMYLTNGTTGFVENVYKDTFNGKTMTIDFRPDYSKKSFKNVTFDYNHLYAVPGQEDDNNDFTSHFNDKIEFGYAITTHSSQGSQWNKVLYLSENFLRSNEDKKKLLYTGITRAQKSITIVI